MLDLEATLSSRLGLRLRRDETRSFILRTLELEPSTWPKSGREVLLQDRSDLDDRLDLLAEGLARIAERPVTGRLVVETLGITNQERLRWTKAGRLRQAGSASIRRAHTLYIQTYDPDRLGEITPDQIAAWRAEDRTTRPAKREAENI